MAVEEKKVADTSAKPKSLDRVEGEIFALAVVGGDGNKVTVYNRLRAMTAKQRHHLRRSMEFLDEVLDQVALDLHFERNKSRTKGGRKDANK